MKVEKSSRHQKIIGYFGEMLVCNWLSRSGFEVMSVDHTGIDIIAYNPSTKQRFGITVKSRTREKGKETSNVNLFLKRKRDREKLLDACRMFECEPWIAVYVETPTYADLYLTSLENYDKKYHGQEKTIETWKMGKKYREQYEKDRKVKHIHLEFEATNWDWNR